MIIEAAKRLETVKEYYFSIKLRQIRELVASGKDIINLGIGSPDLPPSEHARNAAIETIREDKAHGYQSYTGIPALRQAMSDWYQRTYQVTLNPNGELLPLMGSKEGIMHISMAFLNAGDEVLVPNPGYLTYSSVSRLVGAKIRYYNLEATNNWQPNLQEIETSGGLEKVKIMWVNYPHMPTGADANHASFEALIAFAKKHQLLLVNDNPYSLVLNNKPSSILQVAGAKEVALELNSLSKSHNMAGWRVGMLAGKVDYLQNVLKVKSNMDSGMFLGIQKAAIASFQNTKEWHTSQNDIYAKRKAIAIQILETLGCSFDPQQVGLFVWAKVPKNVDSVETWTDEILDKAEVFITPGFIFGSAGEKYVRISLCSSVERLREASKRIQGAGVRSQNI